MDNILYAERSLQMDKAHVRIIATNPTISEHKENISNPYRDTIRTHCMQRRHQGRLCMQRRHQGILLGHIQNISRIYLQNNGNIF